MVLDGGQHWIRSVLRGLYVGNVRTPGCSRRKPVGKGLKPVGKVLKPVGKGLKPVGKGLLACLSTAATSNGTALCPGVSDESHG